MGGAKKKRNIDVANIKCESITVGGKDSKTFVDITPEGIWVTLGDTYVGIYNITDQGPCVLISRNKTGLPELAFTVGEDKKPIMQVLGEKDEVLHLELGE